MRKWALLLLASLIILLPLLESLDIWDPPWETNPGDLEMPVQWYALLLAYALLQKLLLFLGIAVCGGFAFGLRSGLACSHRTRKPFRARPVSLIPLRI